MKFYSYMAGVALALVALVVPSHGQCPNCGPAAPVSLNPGWVERPAQPGWYYSVGLNPPLMCDDAGRWARCVNGAWSDWIDAPPPVALPVVRRPEPVGMPTGVIQSELGKGRAPFSVSGRPVSRDAALRMVEKGEVPDDVSKRRITVVGPTAERKAALEIIGQPPWAVVKAYEPTHWHVSPEYGFVNGGRPTVYVQDPDGTVVHRQDDITGLATAIRRADPKYDPSKDPDLREVAPAKGGKPAPKAAGSGIGPDHAVAFGGGGALALLLTSGVPLFLRWMRRPSPTALALQAIVARLEAMNGGAPAGSGTAPPKEEVK